MSGIAEVMHILGYEVQGSDVAEGYVVEGLARARHPDLDRPQPGQSRRRGGGGDLDRDRKDNPEVAAAYERRIPVVRRAEMLAELMRLKRTVAVAGTHGKTTTTSMIAALLDAGGIDPTVINGGIINAYGSNARLGKSEWMVVEADESDGTFLRLDGTIAVVTNIDPEHLDHYGGFERSRTRSSSSSRTCPSTAPPCSASIMPRCSRSSRGSGTGGSSPTASRRRPTYAARMSCRCRAATVSTSRCATAHGEVRTIAGIELPMPGRHNVQNALAAIGVAAEMGIADEVIARGFERFGGVKRRFTKVGEVDGISIIDDYGHHPVEIAAVLSAAREGVTGRVIAVVQPHRYSRLNDLMAEFQAAFNDADIVLVAPVYPAGEAPIEGVSHEALVEGLRQRGHLGAHAAADPDDVARQLAGLAAPGDMIIFLGAGDITKWAAGFAEGLKARRAK